MTETIYNPEHIIKKLKELYRIVEGVEEHLYNQDLWHMSKSECGCAGFHYEKKKEIDLYDLYSSYVRPESEHFGISIDQAVYIFESMPWLEVAAHDNEWPLFPGLSQRDAALKRIEFVIKDVGG